MQTTRRGFIKATGLAFGTSLAYGLATQSEAFALDASPDWKLVNTEECTNICCYCAGGCGSLCSVRDGELISVEGDPDHPISQGGLCAKGASMFQLRNVVDEKTRKVIPNPGRLTRPMVRRPGASDWEEISWDEAVTSIARKVKDTRDATFVEVDQGVVANRCDGMASLGGSQQNCEEDYAIVKTMRTLGIVALDNQARV
ncbi:MAG: molybdopterin-dependent oxidoreductase [Eggerthellaceae bacterium]|jgi:formate dehydrogenase major subunit|nr:molybdopterin-dependent oxidoreductase [Eggerthellaceae bacterium]